MDLFLCSIENNADFDVRVVTISGFGQSDRIIRALTTIVTQFQKGPKVMLTFRADTKELIEFHGILVSRASRFKVFPTLPAPSLPVGGGPSHPAPLPALPDLDEGTPTGVSGGDLSE